MVSAYLKERFLMYNIGSLLTPVWDTRIVYRETFAMIKEGDTCKAPFLYKPDRILKIESYDGTGVYELGRDCYLDGNEIHMAPGTRIKMMCDKRFLDSETVDDNSNITDHQIAITYRTTDTWKGFLPSNQIDNLISFKKKIENREKLNIVLYGDSICCGFDKGAEYDSDQHQPIWPKALIDGLRDSYAYDNDRDVQLINVSESGKDLDWAYDNVGSRVFGYDPDLVILGFGNKDRTDGSEYANKTLKIIDKIRDRFPKCEFVLISTILPDPDKQTPSIDFDQYQSRYSDALNSITSRGIVLADVQSVYKEILKHKRYADITGNLQGYPNEFISAVYAQVLYETLRFN